MGENTCCQARYPKFSPYDDLWWKEKTNAHKLFSESHTHAGAHVHTITLKEKKSGKKERLIQLPKNH